MGCTAIDAGLGAVTIASMATGEPIVFEPWSSALKSMDNGDMTAGEYYANTLPNIATLGVYGQGRAVRQWWNGDITDDEMQQNVGGTAVLQIAPVVVKKGVAVYSQIKTNSGPILQHARDTHHFASKDCFPTNPNDLLPELPRNAKGHIFPNSNTRIRPEQHPLKPGETHNPRHHDLHYHVDIRNDPQKSFNNPNNTTKVLPPDYVSGGGTGFLPGEPFPP
jgi:hypothetical protein